MCFNLCFEDFEIPDLDCGTPIQDLGYFRFYTLVRRKDVLPEGLVARNVVDIPETIEEDSLASWVGRRAIEDPRDEILDGL